MHKYYSIYHLRESFKIISNVHAIWHFMNIEDGKWQTFVAYTFLFEASLLFFPIALKINVMQNKLGTIMTVHHDTSISAA